MVDYDKGGDDYDIRDLVSDLNDIQFGSRNFARSVMNSLKVEQIGQGSHRTVFKHKDIDSHIIKVANDGAVWANERENEISNKGTIYDGKTQVPKEIIDRTAVVSSADRSSDGPKWILMEKLNTKHVQKDHGRFLWKLMLDLGWGVADLRLDNIGLLRGEPMLMDYTYLKPVDAMLPKPKRRVRSGHRW